MKYVQGKILKHQGDFTCGFRLKMLESWRMPWISIGSWIEDNNIRVLHFKTNRSTSRKYEYLLFINKDDAVNFKMVWG